ncbi:MAG: tRNA (guanosine(46)-N7)-methyltransferase TrmB [Xanthomonadales bacterium]|nr:tRNA (guanosine(46)-N7)-methyltransferase TrmB [Xanthomonadales bacterium]
MADRVPRQRRRPVRSYVLRKGRVTEAQSRALQDLTTVYGLACDGPPIDAEAEFERPAPLVVEIGFGNGEATWRMAAAEPDKNFIGIEVHAPGVGQLMMALEKHQLSNVRVARCDAVSFLHDRLQPNSISEIRIFFPDPWPKKRHHKRRIIQPEFLSLLETRLEPGGFVHIATDWTPYMEHICEVFTSAPAFTGKDSSAAESRRPATKYEQRGQRLGHPIVDLVYCYRAGQESSG